MFGKAMLLKMFEYNHWANTHLLDYAAKVTPEQWDAPHDYCRGGLHQTMYHLLIVEQGWLHYCQHKERRTDRKSIEELATPESLRAFADEIYATIHTFLDDLSDDDIAAEFAVQWVDGSEHTFSMWHVLTHVLYHGAQHRSEVAALLTAYGQSPGDIDFIFFVA